MLKGVESVRVGGKFFRPIHRQALPSGLQCQSVAGSIKSMKHPNYTIGNRTRDLPACGIVPQPTAPPGARDYFLLQARPCGICDGHSDTVTGFSPSTYIFG